MWKINIVSAEILLTQLNHSLYQVYGSDPILNSSVLFISHCQKHQAALVTRNRKLLLQVATELWVLEALPQLE